MGSVTTGSHPSLQTGPEITFPKTEGTGTGGQTHLCFALKLLRAEQHLNAARTSQAEPSCPLLCCPPSRSAVHRGYVVGQDHAHRPPPPPLSQHGRLRGRMTELFKLTLIVSKSELDLSASSMRTKGDGTRPH